MELSAKASIRQAQEIVKEAQIALSYSEITSLVTGVVVERMIDPGDLAVPGKSLLIIQTSGALRLEANVREGLISRVVRKFESYLATGNEVTNFVSFTGISSPMDFNGMVRHYFIRKSGHLADIRVNLAHKSDRQQQSHTILLRIRKDLEKIAQDNNAQVQLVEVPPGPPVLSTLVAEIYGSYDKSYEELLQGAMHMKTIILFIKQNTKDK